MTHTACSLIADFSAAAEEIERLLAPSACVTLAAHAWIVLDDFGPLTFTLVPEGKTHRATCTGHGRAHKVNRFMQHDAERLASACNASVAFWADAAREEAVTLRRHIAALEATGTTSDGATYGQRAAP